MSSSFQLQMNISFSPKHKDEYSSLYLHSLRINLPDEIGSMISKNSKTCPIDTYYANESSNDDTEYVASSPCYTWSDDNVRSVKQEKFGELLWPIVLKDYKLTVNSFPSLSTYSAFIKSDIYQHSNRYPHNSIRDLMVYYIEEYIQIMKGKDIDHAERENLKRRCLLRKLFLYHRIVWSPEYMDVYMEWSKGCREGMNRYLKMDAFVKNFFDV